MCDGLGCCAASFVEYGILVNTTQEYDNCNAKLSQPCSDGDEPGSDGGPTIEVPTDGGPTDGGPTDRRSGEPDSGLSATPAFLVIAALTLITSIFF